MKLDDDNTTQNIIAIMFMSMPILFVVAAIIAIIKS